MDRHCQLLFHWQKLWSQSRQDSLRLEYLNIIHIDLFNHRNIERNHFSIVKTAKRQKNQQKSIINEKKNKKKITLTGKGERKLANN